MAADLSRSGRRPVQERVTPMGAAEAVLDLSLNMLDEADGREPRLPAGDVWFGDATGGHG
jgi:hypothetical protein